MKKIITTFILIMSFLVLVGCSNSNSVVIPSGEEKTKENDVPSIVDIDYKIDSGRYSGRADSNFIEIKISGVPEEISYRVFMLSEEIKADFDRLDLQTDEVIQFKYTVNEHEQGIIFEIKRI